MASLTGLRAEGVKGVPCVAIIYALAHAEILDLKAPRQHRRVNCRPALSSIAKRPAVVNGRSEPGPREADQIIGKANRSSMIWWTERVSRFLIAVTMPSSMTPRRWSSV